MPRNLLEKNGNRRERYRILMSAHSRNVAIGAKAQLATFIQLWRMQTRSNQCDWLRAMHGRIHLLQSKPGFKSMTLHPSLDGLNVVVYAQWTSPEDLERAAADAKVREARKELDLHGQPDGTLFRVDTVYLPKANASESMLIEPESRPFVFINVWTTPSEQNQQNLLAEMKSETAAIVAKKGSSGMAYHVSLDGSRLVVYALWDSALAFDAAITNCREAMENRKRLARLGQASANSYRVDSVYLSSPETGPLPL